MSKQATVRPSVDSAEAQLREVIVVGRSLLRHAEKLHVEMTYLKSRGIDVHFVPLPEDGDSISDREQLAAGREALPPILRDLHARVDGCRRHDEELRSAIGRADVAIRSAAGLIDVTTVSAEDRTTIRIRRRLRELRDRTPSPGWAGWAQVAEPTVQCRIAETLERLVEDMQTLQLIASSEPCHSVESDSTEQHPKRRRSRAGGATLTTGPKLQKVEVAICRLAQPGYEWTIPKLARAVGCRKQTLYGSEKFMRAWEGMKAHAVLRSGSKYDGQVDAVHTEDLTAGPESEKTPAKWSAPKATPGPNRPQSSQ